MNTEKLKEYILGLLFPRRCPACHDIVLSRGSIICPGCERKFSRVSDPVCLKCGKEINSPGRNLCYDCEKGPKPFEANTAVFNYDKTARESMIYFKYRHRPEYADYYVRELLRFRGDVIRGFAPGLIIPVPVHKSRLTDRGYNQAAEIAERLGRELSVPVRTDLLLRTKRTEAQKSLGASGRERNLEGAFSCEADLRGLKSVLLVDDIYTTGSTLSACARALKNAGAERVYCATVCIGRDS